jgi:CubicO group peptidase (beta-lactamase class C family)
MLQQQGLVLDQRLFSAQTIRQATRDQLPEIPGLSETARQGKGWGLGWQIVTRAKSDYYGDLLSDQAYGHGGATGTVLWIDPQLDAAAIILTTEPQEPHGRYLARLSNAIVAAIEV